MKKIAIFLFDNAIASTITGPMDIFSSAGIMWNFLMEQDLEPRFLVELASQDGKPVRCFNNLVLAPHTCLEEVQNPDLVLIPAVADDIGRALADNQALLPRIRAWHEKGIPLAGVCTGTFFLAEAGVLDGKTATTHWAYAQAFSKAYPKVRLDTRPLITRDENIICTAGSSSWTELSLYLVEVFCGKQVAVECSKILLLDMSRSSQAPYGVTLLPERHQDEKILAVQEWLKTHYPEKIRIETLAGQSNMSPRTFKRRFKEATGHAPLAYLQLLRVEAARGMLEQTCMSVEQLAEKCGYEDISFFRKLFKRHTGLSPNQYRKSFAGFQKRGGYG